MRKQSALRPILFFVTFVLVVGCKEAISPHVSPEGDVDLKIAEALAFDRPPGQPAPSAEKRILLTINDAPAPNQPLEQELLQRVVELFEKRNPGIRVEFRGWQFTPESFFERAKDRSLTDVVEVAVSQIPPILEMSGAADITDNFNASPAMKNLSHEASRLLQDRNGRVYGVPTDLYTLALFYNRALVDAVLNPPSPRQDSSKKTDVPGKKSDQGKKEGAEKKKSNEESKKTESGEKKNGASGRRSDPDRKSENIQNDTHEDSQPDLPVPAKTEKKKSRGAEGEPREFVELQFAKEPVLLAQYADPYGYYYQQGEDETRRGYYSRRAQQEIQDNYSVRPERQSRRRQQSQGYYDPYRNYYGYNQPQAPGYGYDNQDQRRSRRQLSEEESASPSFNQSGPQDNPALEGTPRSRRKRDALNEGASGETTATRKPAKASTSTSDEDVLTTEAEAAAAITTQTQQQDHATTIVKATGIPEDWEGFIRLAVKLTDHSKGVYGFAPSLFAQEGGREYTQWAMQTGLQMEITRNGTTTLDVNTSQAAEVAQFLKELHWRLDCTPAPEKCYTSNLLKMFAEGKVGMIILPANRLTIERLLKLGMKMDDLGIAKLPAGPSNRSHLVFGKSLIINSQLDREHRAAAFKWLEFQLDPEVMQMRDQLYSREQELTGLPRVPILTAEKEKQFEELRKPYRRLPLFEDYQTGLTKLVAFEPPYYTERFYEAVAEGIRPIVERQDSDPQALISYVAVDFDRKYLRKSAGSQGLLGYLQPLTGE